jgi:hypothetical protein
MVRGVYAFGLSALAKACERKLFLNLTDARQQLPRIVSSGGLPPFENSQPVLCIRARFQDEDNRFYVRPLAVVWKLNSQPDAVIEADAGGGDCRPVISDHSIPPCVATVNAV